MTGNGTQEFRFGRSLETVLLWLFGPTDAGETSQHKPISDLQFQAQLLLLQAVQQVAGRQQQKAQVPPAGFRAHNITTPYNNAQPTTICVVTTLAWSHACAQACNTGVCLLLCNCYNCRLGSP